MCEKEWKRDWESWNNKGIDENDGTGLGRKGERDRFVSGDETEEKKRTVM